VKKGSEKSHTKRKQEKSVLTRLGDIGRGIKKRKRKKLDTRTKIHAALAAAALIITALIASVTAAYLHSGKIPDEPALVQERLPVPVAPAPPETEPPAKAPAVSAPVPVAKEPMPPAKPEPVKPPATSPQPVNSPPARTPPVNTPPAPAERAPTQRPAPERPSGTAPAARSNPVSSQTGGIVEKPAFRGSLAFVIDDAGNNLRDLEPFLKFPGPLSIAVLPGLPGSAEAARRIRAAGKEVFLHQPMESLGGHNPGPGAIRVDMDRDEIKTIVNRNLDELWPVAGINNHEGSRVTMDDEVMETVLGICRERGIVFLDSRTTADTAVPRVARRMGMSIGERDVFIDNIQERESMLGYINSGLTKAEQKGAAIMIGHVSSPALYPLLAELFPDLNEQGYSFSTASKIILGLKQ